MRSAEGTLLRRSLAGSLRLRADVPTTSVVLSMFADEGQMRTLEHAGAAAVVLKQAPSAALIAALEQARAGRH